MLAFTTFNYILKLCFSIASTELFVGLWPTPFCLFFYSIHTASLLHCSDRDRQEGRVTVWMESTGQTCPPSSTAEPNSSDTGWGHWRPFKLWHNQKGKTARRNREKKETKGGCGRCICPPVQHVPAKNVGNQTVFSVPTDFSYYEVNGDHKHFFFARNTFFVLLNCTMGWEKWPNSFAQELVPMTSSMTSLSHSSHTWPEVVTDWSKYHQWHIYSANSAAQYLTY